MLGRRAAAGVLVGLCLALPGCTSTPAAPTSSAPAVTGSPDTPAGSASASPSGSEANTVVIDITIANRQVTPSGQKLDLTRGQKVILNVTSDQDDEIHAHTAGDGYELEVTAGKPATGSFVVTDSGSFEIESHHLNKIIAILNVR
jgi:hypothetical protein